ILQLDGVIQKSRHIAANGLIKQNRERRNRLRQRKHVWRRERLGSGFRRSLELKACALSDQARRRGVHPRRSLGPVKLVSECASGHPSGDNQGRHQGNKHSIDRLRPNQPPPRRLTPTVPTDPSQINPSAVNNLLKGLIRKNCFFNLPLEMLTNLRAQWRGYSKRLRSAH